MLRNALLAPVLSSSAAAAAATTAEYDSDALARTTAFASDPQSALTDAQLSHFLIEGFCCLPGIVPTALCKLLKVDVDIIENDRSEGRAMNNVGYEHVGKLCSYPPVVSKVRQLAERWGNGRSDVAMHHVNASRHGPGIYSALPPWLSVPGA
jgi:hypothetical protein